MRCVWAPRRNALRIHSIGGLFDSRLSSKQAPLQSQRDGAWQRNPALLSGIICCCAQRAALNCFLARLAGWLAGLLSRIPYPVSSGLDLVT